MSSNQSFIPVNDVPNYEELISGRLGEKVTEKGNLDSVTNEKPNRVDLENTPEFIWGFLFDFFGSSVHADGNRIYFHSEIHKDSVEQVKEKIIEVSRDIIPKYIDLGITNPADMEIKLYIDSLGGAISSGFNLIDFMDNHYIPITTIGSGTIASMATLLLVSGKKRYLTKNSHLLVHQFRAGFSGKREELLDYFKHLEDVQDQLVEYVSNNTNLEINQVIKLLKSESWLTTDQALSMGFADKII